MPPPCAASTALASGTTTVRYRARTAAITIDRIPGVDNTSPRSESSPASTTPASRFDGTWPVAASTVVALQLCRSAFVGRWPRAVYRPVVSRRREVAIMGWDYHSAAASAAGVIPTLLLALVLEKQLLVSAVHVSDEVRRTLDALPRLVKEVLAKISIV